jgi:hypothetical protein
MAMRILEGLPQECQPNDVEALKEVLIFCGIGLLVSLLAIETYGLDSSVGFF